MIYTLGDRRLETRSAEYYVAPSAQLIGSVRLGHEASIWFNVVIRADNDWIEIGDGSNVQDGSVIHTDPGLPVIVGRNATIAHMAFLHGCTVADDAMVANGAMVLDRARIGRYSIVAAGALVPPDKIIPDGVVVVGSPAKVVREVTDEDRRRIAHAAEVYRARGREYRSLLKPA
jgi:carbonic anhydrase/acetyltransferase-like protein (isoleucine patch superfamily)